MESRKKCARSSLRSHCGRRRRAARKCYRGVPRTIFRLVGPSGVAWDATAGNVPRTARCRLALDAHLGSVGGGLLGPSGRLDWSCPTIRGKSRAQSAASACSPLVLGVWRRGVTTNICILPHVLSNRRVEGQGWIVIFNWKRQPPKAIQAAPGATTPRKKEKQLVVRLDMVC